MRIRCKPRVPRVGGLLLFSVSGVSGRLLLGIGYDFVVFVGISIGLVPGLRLSSQLVLSISRLPDLLLLTLLVR